MACCCGGPPKVPQFPIRCSVWFSYVGALPPMVGANLVAIACQLRAPETSQVSNALAMGMYLLVAKLTDIAVTRFPANGADLVECPSGSGRYYNVTFVDDVAKGFANEYRRAVLIQAPPWPTPTP